MKKNVVVIGGGNGSAKTIRACRQFISEINLSAVISVSDSGGSSGRLRDEFGTLPPGDVLRAILAMSPVGYEELKAIFYTPRFDIEGKLNKHNLGNLFLTLAAQYSGNFIGAMRALEQALGAEGRVYPATLAQTTLVAGMSDGTHIEGEHEIDRPTKKDAHIERITLDPDGPAYEQAMNVLRQADYIVFGPGSLYCSIVAAILPDGIRDAIDQSKAKLIYVTGNAYEIDGELGPKTLSGYVKGLQQYLPRKIDVVVHNNSELSDDQTSWYKAKGWAVFEPDVENLSEYTLIQGNYDRDERSGLSAIKMSKLLQEIIVPEYEDN